MYNHSHCQFNCSSKHTDKNEPKTKISRKPTSCSILNQLVKITISDICVRSASWQPFPPTNAEERQAGEVKGRNSSSWLVSTCSLAGSARRGRVGSSFTSLFASFLNNVFGYLLLHTYSDSQLDQVSAPHTNPPIFVHKIQSHLKMKSCQN